MKSLGVSWRAATIACVVLILILKTAFPAGHLGLDQVPLELPKTTHRNSSGGRYGVMGILSSSTSASKALRYAQRRTWIKPNPDYSIKHRFLLDKPNPELEQENAIFNDLVYLNSTFSGRLYILGKNYQYCCTRLTRHSQMPLGCERWTMMFMLCR